MSQHSEGVNIFVYDNFRRGCEDNIILMRKFGGQFRTTDRCTILGMIMFDLFYYPVAVRSFSKTHTIVGETMIVSEEVLSYMDKHFTEIGLYQDIISINDKLYICYLKNNMSTLMNKDIVDDGDWTELMSSQSMFENNGY